MKTLKIKKIKCVGCRKEFNLGGENADYALVKETGEKLWRCAFCKGTKFVIEETEEVYE
jgi:hypothetical protein